MTEGIEEGTEEDRQEEEEIKERGACASTAETEVEELTKPSNQVLVKATAERGWKISRENICFDITLMERRNRTEREEREQGECGKNVLFGKILLNTRIGGKKKENHGREFCMTSSSKTIYNHGPEPNYLFSHPFCSSPSVSHSPASFCHFFLQSNSLEKNKSLSKQT